MTPEQTEEIIKALSDLKETNIFMGIASIFMLCMIIVWFAMSYVYTKKRQKQIEEWKATLTEEQRKAVNEYKKITKN